MKIQRKTVMKGWKMMLATFSMLHLNSKHPKDLVTAMAAIVRKSAYAIQLRTMAETLENIYVKCWFTICYLFYQQNDSECGRNP